MHTGRDRGSSSGFSTGSEPPSCCVPAKGCGTGGVTYHQPEELQTRRVVVHGCAPFGVFFLVVYATGTPAVKVGDSLAFDVGHVGQVVACNEWDPYEQHYITSTDYKAANNGRRGYWVRSLEHAQLHEVDDKWPHGPDRGGRCRDKLHDCSMFSDWALLLVRRSEGYLWLVAAAYEAICLGQEVWRSDALSGIVIKVATMDAVSHMRYNGSVGERRALLLTVSEYHVSCQQPLPRCPPSHPEWAYMRAPPCDEDQGLYLDASYFSASKRAELALVNSPDETQIVRVSSMLARAPSSAGGAVGAALRRAFPNETGLNWDAGDGLFCCLYRTAVRVAGPFDGYHRVCASVVTGGHLIALGRGTGGIHVASPQSKCPSTKRCDCSIQKRSLLLGFEPVATQDVVDWLKTWRMACFVVPNLSYDGWTSESTGTTHRVTWPGGGFTYARTPWNGREDPTRRWSPFGATWHTTRTPIGAAFYLITVEVGRVARLPPPGALWPALSAWWDQGRAAARASGVPEIAHRAGVVMADGDRSGWGRAAVGVAVASALAEALSSETRVAVVGVTAPLMLLTASISLPLRVAAGYVGGPGAQTLSTCADVSDQAFALLFGATVILQPLPKASTVFSAAAHATGARDFGGRLVVAAAGAASSTGLPVLPYQQLYYMVALAPLMEEVAKRKHWAVGPVLAFTELRNMACVSPTAGLLQLPAVAMHYGVAGLPFWQSVGWHAAYNWVSTAALDVAAPPATERGLVRAVVHSTTTLTSIVDGLLPHTYVQHYLTAAATWIAGA